MRPRARCLPTGGDLVKGAAALAGGQPQVCRGNQAFRSGEVLPPRARRRDGAAVNLPKTVGGALQLAFFLFGGGQAGLEDDVVPGFEENEVVDDPSQLSVERAVVLGGGEFGVRLLGEMNDVGLQGPFATLGSVNERPVELLNGLAFLFGKMLPLLVGSPKLFGSAHKGE